jgi:transcriptional regulator with XRE-family HTH domain
MFVMAYPPYVRDKAREMRVKKGMTIDELAERLAISRTTIYYWVEGLPIATTRTQTLAARRAGNASRRKHRLLRDAAYREGRALFAEFSRDPTFRDFVCMYIGEGYKRDRNRVSLANSDPAVILLAKRWFDRCARNPIRFSIQFHADQDVAELRRYWAGTLGVDPDLIDLQRKSNSGQLSGRVWRCKYGVITIRSCDTRFRAQMQAWMDRIRDEWVVDSNSFGA